MSNVHVKYRGTSYDLALEDLFPEDRLEIFGISDGQVPTADSVSDTLLRRALAEHFDVALSDFEDMFIEKNPNGNITVRPEAVFG